MKKGKVWLVGAGPSDIGLFTIKGKEVLQSADVVLYDKLVGEGIINLIPRSSKKIYVGKQSGYHSVTQDNISRMLLEEAIKGNKVVRLKGGDPFLFGRGGEELELLAKNNIDFEVVPGITSAISVPAYSGIPVTHRDYSSSVHIITGKNKNKDIDIDFKTLSKLEGTLIFLMGVSSLDIICESLIDGGMDKRTPAAIIQKGTTSKQNTLLSTLEFLPKLAKEKKVETPGIIIVGKVASLHSELNWVDKLSLSGLKVLVTRPERQASKLSKKLYEKGAEVLEVPTIETNIINENIKLLNSIKNINNYQWIVLTSPTGVEMLFRFLIENNIDLRGFSNIKFAVVGDATSKVLKEKGIIADFVPSKYNGETLGKELTPYISGKVLIPRARIGSSNIIEIFNKNNIECDDIGIYETKIIKQELSNIEEIDYIAFTSASTVKGFIQSVGNINYEGIKGICIGEETEKVAKEYGIKTYVSEEATLDSMVILLEKLKGGEKNET